MPPAGLGPTTFAFAAHTITQLTNWADGFSQILEGGRGQIHVSPKMAPFLANRG